jgi:hypothetical protein
MSYHSESRELDAKILRVIDAWHRHGTSFSDAEFNELALRIFAYQLKYNETYARYCASLGVTASSLPDSWEAIPAVPSAAFKEAVIATFDPAHAALAFETSGTTIGVGGRHYMETRALYDAALLAGFDRFMLPDGTRLRYANLVPNPSQSPHSSLGYMMQQVSLHRGDGQTGWYISDDTLFFEALLADLNAAIADNQPVCIATTAFALAYVLDELESRSVRLALPKGSRIMETGGFKGRAKIVDRSELYDRASTAVGIDGNAIVAEYGMTELTSQYYDDVSITSAPRGRRKLSPPWLRPRVVGPDGRTLPNGTVGALVHVDLGNRSSCVAILTEDLGAQFEASTDSAGGLLLIGREEGAALRGCSLDAETLLPT